MQNLLIVLLSLLPFYLALGMVSVYFGSFIQKQFKKEFCHVCECFWLSLATGWLFGQTPIECAYATAAAVFISMLTSIHVWRLKNL